MRIRRVHVVVAVAVCLIAVVVPFRRRVVSMVAHAAQTSGGKKTVAERVVQYGDAARGRLAPDFKKAGVDYPPKRIILAAFKSERIMEVWVSQDGRSFRRLRDYDILAASGNLGPKLREGDRQVPEGVYRIESLNPNSLYHLSLRVNYPNEFDRRKGKEENRSNFGGDIMIHGKNCSIGCLAMGDEAAEDLFVLAAETGIENIEAIISPVDFRQRELPKELPQLPVWYDELCKTIKERLNALKE